MSSRKIFFALALLGLAAWVSSAVQPDYEHAHRANGFELKSPAFSEGQTLPSQFTSSGSGVSPPLAWTGVPKGTRELVLVLEDIDAPHGPYTHWVIYGLSPGLSGLPSGLPTTEELKRRPVTAFQGANSQGKDGYTPPDPPPGDAPHHYQFRLFALNKAVPLEPGLGRHEVLTQIQLHVLAEADLMGTYGKS